MQRLPFLFKKLCRLGLKLTVWHSWHVCCKFTVAASFSVRRKDGSTIMLWTILMVILVLWLLGLIGGVGGSLIHLLLIIAAVVLILQLVTGRRAVV